MSNHEGLYDLQHACYSSHWLGIDLEQIQQRDMTFLTCQANF